jgi:hypothetical protein
LYLKNFYIDLKENIMTDTNDILDGTIDDLADLPSNAAFPAGCHLATMFLSAPKPKPGKKQQVVAKFVYKSTEEMADATSEAPNPGDESTMFISLFKKDGDKNEYGEGQLKQLLAPLVDAGLTGSKRELIDATKPGVDVRIVTGTRDYNGVAQMTLAKIELVD